MTLYKKLFRDLMEHKGANIAAIVVIAIGLMMYAAFAMVMQTLELSIDKFYSDSKFPDGFVTVLTMPKSKIADIKDIEGISEAEGRLREDIRIADNFGTFSTETKYLRLVSSNTSVGTYIIEEGKAPRAGYMETVVDPMFADANDLKVGDKIPVIAYGKNVDLTISAIGRSAENVYALRNSSEIYPDPIIFGVGFMDITSLEKLTGKGHYTNVVFTIKDDADFDYIKRTIERELRPYGFISIVEKKDQESNLLLTNEMKQLEVSSTMLPLVFLSVSSMILYIMIKRIVEQQRGQIGILKAFGYSSLSIRMHYTSYCIVIGLLGGIIGGLFGLIFYQPLMSLYMMFFNMPILEGQILVSYLFRSIAISVVFAIFAGYRGSTQALLLSPSEAMREKEPVLGSRSLFEKIPLLYKALTTKGKMALRNISRNPARSFFVFVGIAFTFTLSVIPWTFMGQVDSMLFERYDDVEKYDVKVALSDLNALESVETEFTRHNEVYKAEGMLEIPVFFTNEHIKEPVSVIGLRENSDLYTVIDDDKNPVNIYKGGVVLSERLADKLRVKTGDYLTMESPYMRDKDKKERVRVISTVKQNVGINGYMDIEYLSAVLGYSPAANSVLLRAKPNTAAVLKDIYEESPKITGINDTNEMIEKLKKFMGSFMGSMYYVALIAIVMGVAIIYNSYVIILSERKRELSSLMVLGMSEKEVLSIVTFEQWFIAIFAMLFGIPLSQSAVTAMGKSASTDMFSLAVKLDLNSLIIAFVVTIIAIVLAQVMASRKIKHLNIVDALKSNE